MSLSLNVVYSEWVPLSSISLDGRRYSPNSSEVAVHEHLAVTHEMCFVSPIVSNDAMQPHRQSKHTHGLFNVWLCDVYASLYLCSIMSVGFISLKVHRFRADVMNER